jgi:ribose 5-phosphate isomerase B
MIIAIASDHAGFKLKESLKKTLLAQRYSVIDLGTVSEDSTDYPDFAKKAAEEVSKKRAELGVLVCGSGIGMAMAANRFRGIRAAVINDEFDAQMSRSHNNANIACFAARKLSEDEANRLLAIWLTAKFEGGRHEKRVKKIEI